MKRTTIYLEDTDRAAIEVIKRAYGVSTNSDAIRLALRLMAGQKPTAKKAGGEK